MTSIEIGKTKRFIKRTHNRNPTFHSFLISDILQYQPTNPNPSIIDKQSKVKQRSSSLANINPQIQKQPLGKVVYFDSLYHAQNQFDKIRLRNPLNFIERKSNPINNNSESQSPASIRNELKKESIGRQQIKKTNVKWIKQKQSWNYNIINNITSKQLSL